MHPFVPGQNAPAPTAAPARATSFTRATRFIKTQSSPAEKSFTHSGGSARPYRHVRRTREHATNAARSRKSSAPPALVSFIAVPQSMEVPLCGPLHTLRALLVPPFDPSSNQQLSCTSGFSARCHLRPALPSESQMTTSSPAKGNITDRSVICIVDVGFPRPFFRRP
jgi:hypothetical protein